MSNHGQSHLILFNLLYYPFFKTKQFAISSTFNHHYLTNHSSSKYRLLVKFSKKNADEFLSCSSVHILLVGFNEPHPQKKSKHPGRSVHQMPMPASSSVGSKSSAGRSASTRTPCSTSMAVAGRKFRAPKGGRWRSLRQWRLQQRLNKFPIGYDSQFAMEAMAHFTDGLPFLKMVDLSMAHAI